MKIFYFALSISLFLPLGVEAQQQIYETTDEQGNRVFTDAPPTEEAKPVELGTSNIADSVEVRPPEPTPVPRKNPAPDGELHQDTPAYIGGDDDLREDVYEAHRKNELRDRATDGNNTPEHLPTAKPRPAVRPAGGGRR
jgi:hypothetical protein